MAVAITNLTSGNSAVNGPWTTASVTPTSNALLLLTVHIRNGNSINPTTPTISGNGLTWVLVDSINEDNNSTSRKTTFLFRALGLSPSTGAITITGGEVETNCDWILDQATGVSIAGTNGSGAIVQHLTAAQLVSPTVTSLSVTLGALSNINNATYGVIGSGTNDSFVAGSGYTIIGSNSTGLFEATEFKAVGSTTVNFTFNADFEVGMIALEIAALTTTVTFQGVGSNSWICPPGVTSIQVAAQGGGGAGGARLTTGGGGGGGGGEYAKETSVTVTPGTTYTATVGIGGTNNGTTVVQGGSSSFAGDNVTVTAHGGTSVANNTVTGGAGGTGSTNGTHHNGGAGFTSAGSTGGGGGSAASDTTVGVTATSATGAASPSGAASGFGGPGGAGTTTGNTNGNSPVSGQGGGGGGADRSSSGTRAGGSGWSGQVILNYLTPLAENLTDNFDTNVMNTAKWNSFGTVAFATGQFKGSNVSGVSGAGGIFSLEYYNLTGSYVFSQLVTANTSITSFQNIPILLQLDANNSLAYFVEGANLTIQKQVATVFTSVNSITYDPAVHKFLRLRESAGITYADYSTDGVTWTNQTNFANVFAMTLLRVEVQAGTYTAAVGSGTGIFDNFNVVLAVVTSQTILGLARITIATLKTVLGKAAILETTLKTILGKSRITVATLQTILGLSRITISTSKTILGKADILKTTLQTILGKAAILKTTLQTILGKARITIATLKTIQGISRVTVSTAQIVLGKSRITVTTLKTVLGKSAILKTTLQIILGVSRITKSTLQTVLGKARVTVSTVQTILGKARITITTLQTILGKSRITIVTLQIILGTSRITISTSKIILGKARITITNLQTILGKSRIQVVVNKTILGIANILSNSSTAKTILGLSRVTVATLKTVLGKAAILLTTAKTILGLSRITALGGTRRNLALNPSFEGSTGWTINNNGSGGTITYPSPDFAQSGLNSAKVVNISATNNSYLRQTINVIPGHTYTLSVYVKVTSYTSNPAAIRILSTSFANLVSTGFSGVQGFTRYSCTYTVPSTGVPSGVSTQIQIILDWLVGTIYYDAVLFEETNVLGSYFDGDLSPATWEGTQYSSISDLIVNTLLGLSRVMVSTLKTILGVSRIQEAINKTILGKARVTIVTSKTIAGISNIIIGTSTTSQTILGKSSIQKTTSKDITGTSRIQIVSIQTILGKSRITNITSQIIQGKSSIEITASKLILGTATIIYTSVDQDIQGVSRVTVHTHQTMKGRALIKSTINTPPQFILVDGKLGFHLVDDIYTRI